MFSDQFQGGYFISEKGNLYDHSLNICRLLKIMKQAGTAMFERKTRQISDMAPKSRKISRVGELRDLDV